MKNMTAHNLNEVKALIKEAFSRGNEEDFSGTQWIAHGGEFLCKSEIKLTEFELVMPDRSSITIEVI